MFKFHDPKFVISETTSKNAYVVNRFCKLLLFLIEFLFFVNVLRAKKGVRFCVTIMNDLKLSLPERISKCGRIKLMMIMHDE
jgi:hypothetical protein